MRERRVLLPSDRHHSIREDGYPGLITTKSRNGRLEGVQKFSPDREYHAMVYTHVFNPQSRRDRLEAHLDLHEWYRVTYAHPDHQNYLEVAKDVWKQVSFMQGVFMAETTANELYLYNLYIQFTDSDSTTRPNQRLLITPLPGLQILNDRMTQVVFEVPMEYSGNF